MKKEALFVLFLLIFLLIFVSFVFVKAENLSFYSVIDQSQINIENYSVSDFSSEKSEWMIKTQLFLSKDNKKYSVNILEFYNETYYEKYLLSEMKYGDFELMEPYSNYIVYYNNRDSYWVSKSKLIVIVSLDESDIPRAIISSILELFPSDLDKNVLIDKYNLYKKPLKTNIFKTQLFSIQSCKANSVTCTMSDGLGDDSYWTYECCSGYCRDVSFSTNNICDVNPLGNSCRNGGSSCVINGGGLGDDTTRTPECCSDWCIDLPVNYVTLSQQYLYSIHS